VFNAVIRTPRNVQVVFYNLSVNIIFEVNIAAEQKQALLVTMFCFLKPSLPSILFTALRRFHAAVSAIFCVIGPMGFCLLNVRLKLAVEWSLHCGSGSCRL